MNELQWSIITNLIKERTGMVASENKRPLIELRIQRLLTQLDHSNVNQLIQHLHPVANTTILQALTECFANHESLFFRHPGSFRGLQNHLLPRIINDLSEQKSLRIWSAGCACGQEVYSIAMLLAEHFPILENWKVSILGTDISPVCIQRAQRAEYSEFEVQRGLPKNYLEKYGQNISDKRWRLNIPQHLELEFSVMNLVLPFWHQHPFDLIMARNVLMYFEKQTQMNVLSRLSVFMNPNSALLLGPSENPLNIFQSKQVEGMIYYCQ